MKKVLYFERDVLVNQEKVLDTVNKGDLNDILENWVKKRIKKKIITNRCRIEVHLISGYKVDKLKRVIWPSLVKDIIDKEVDLQSNLTNL